MHSDELLIPMGGIAWSMSARRSIRMSLTVCRTWSASEFSASIRDRVSCLLKGYGTARRWLSISP